MRARAIKHMGPNGVALGKSWMLKIFTRIVLESQSFHQAARANIGWHGEGDNLLKLKAVESKFQCSAGGPISQVATPELAPKSPTDFCARREWGSEVRNIQARKAGEGSVYLYGPKPPAALIDGASKLVEGSCGFSSVAQGREVAHDFRIGIHGGEWIQIGIFPLAQEDLFHKGSPKL